MTTPKFLWVKAGDNCVVPQTGVRGKVLRVVDTGTLPYCLVRWENGVEGRVSITAVEKDDDE